MRFLTFLPIILERNKHTVKKKYSSLFPPFDWLDMKASWPA